MFLLITKHVNVIEFIAVTQAINFKVISRTFSSPSSDSINV